MLKRLWDWIFHYERHVHRFRCVAVCPYLDTSYNKAGRLSAFITSSCGCGEVRTKHLYGCGEISVEQINTGAEISELEQMVK